MSIISDIVSKNCKHYSYQKCATSPITTYLKNIIFIGKLNYDTC